MYDKDTHTNANSGTAERRQASRAFQRAMAAGLSETYDDLTQHAVPAEFMELLRKADNRKESEA